MVAALMLVGAALLRAQQNPLIDQGVVAYDNLDFETTADLMRRALKSPVTLEVSEQGRALGYLGASEFFLGHRDAAVLAFRDMARLDARMRLDPLLFPPDVQRIYDEARRTVRIVQAEVPDEAELRMGQTVLPIRIIANSQQTIVVTLARESGEDRVTLYSGSITDSLDLTWDGRVGGGNTARSGKYALQVASLSGGRAFRTVKVPLQVTLERQDTLPFPRAPEQSQYLPERSLAGPLKGVVRGFAMGILAIGLPAAMGADTRAMIGPLVVGGAISTSGLVGLLAHPGGRPIESNITYNRRIRETWQRRVDSLTVENRRRRENVRLTIRAESPVVQQGVNP
ncbi:MAG: hypothetical protein HY700_21470 [Gemmatimonadetes bacterium]|nr:hypothetical protein [Gemmatimonadota bacterium]